MLTNVTEKTGSSCLNRAVLPDGLRIILCLGVIYRFVEGNGFFWGCRADGGGRFALLLGGYSRQIYRGDAGLAPRRAYSTIHGADRKKYK